jgi:hypothetical protein
MQAQNTKPYRSSRRNSRTSKTKTLWLRLDWPLLPGCISTAHSRCGRPRCICKAKPPKLHGPYYRWTGLVEGKPTTITLSAAEARDCERRIRRFRRLQERLRRWLARAMQQAPWNQRPA